MKRPWLAMMMLIGLISGIQALRAEEGAQFLDGIGETGLVARYLFNGNTEDWSRNAFHASLKGEGQFVEDEQFGKVLSLSGGEDGPYVQLPGQTLTGLDNLSVTGWVYVRDLTAWQRFFDLGQDTTHNFFCTPVGEERDSGCRARITTSGWSDEQGPSAFRVSTDQWVHLAVVLDAVSQSLSLYVDGVCVAQTENVKAKLPQVINQDDAAANQLYLGKSRYGDAALNAKLYDVRFYRIALSPQQVAVIRHNAISDEPLVVTVPVEQGETLAEQVEQETPYYGESLVGVPDITAETVAGVLPHLPVYLPASYSDGSDGPKVRVIWPSPTENHQVQQPGTYTLTGTVPGTSFEPKVVVAVKPTEPVAGPQKNLEAFGLGQVVLNPDEQGRDTPFIKNRNKFFQGLAQTNPDTFLFNFRDAFGQDQPEDARQLGVWDSPTCRLRGHASGHYLSALAQAYASTSYDAELHADFLAKMNHMIDVLYDLSQKSGKPATEGGPCNADPTTVPTGPGKDDYDSDLNYETMRMDYWNWGTGFISAYPPDQFIMLEHGATYGARNNQIWAPYYTLHKILAGLMDCYEVGDNPKALEIAKGMGIWVYERLKVVPTETRIQMWNRYIAGEFGGMNEAMARLYRITGDPRFLKGATLFDNIDFFFGNVEHEHGLACNVDTLRGKHANQHIPQITGALETYKGTHDPAYYEVAENFWDICTHSYMYCIGGVAGAKNPNNAECFTAQPDSLYTYGFNEGGQNETCATYNMLKLSRQLFMFEQDPRYMDYYEQALYNHILASVDEHSPANTYHVPLNPGARKHFSNGRMNGFTCCNGTGLESNTKLQDSIYFKGTDDQSLYVNLYVPSTVTWPERQFKLTQCTSFPYSDTTTLTVTGKGPLDLHVRVPHWATQGFSVKINGKEQSVKAVPGTYLSLNRTWKSGDTITLTMPFDFYLSPVMDQPNIASLFYGPVLLAAEEPGPRSDWRKVAFNRDDLSQSITGDPATLRFTTNGVNLKPFFEMYNNHSVYFDVTFE